jgi:hypothetical protein
MKIPVYDLIGDVCMTYEDGERLHSAFREAFERGETVELDFARTRIFVTGFFNASVGPLLEKHSKDEVRNRLKFLNLPAAGFEPLRHSVENAERYYHEPDFRKALDKVLEDRAAEA